MKLPDHPTAVAGRYISPPPGQGQRTVVQASVLNSWLDEIVNLLASAGITPDANDQSQITKAIIEHTGQSVFGNALSNPWMRVYQRGQSGTVAASTAEYTTDRWRVTSSAGVSTTWAPAAAVDISDPSGFFQSVKVLEAGPTGGIAAYADPIALQLQGTGTGSSVLSQLVHRRDLGRYSDMAGSLAVQPVGVTADAELRVVTLSDPSTVVETRTTGVQTLAADAWQLVGDAWQDFTPDPSVEYVRLELEITAPSPNVYVTGASLNTAGFAFPFPPVRPLIDDLRDCQRYYETSALEGLAGSVRQVMLDRDYATNANHVREANERFAVPKRETPTVTFYDPAGASGTVDVEGSQLTVSSVEQAKVWQTGYPVVSGLTGSGTALVEYQWAADAELE